MLSKWLGQRISNHALYWHILECDFFWSVSDEVELHMYVFGLCMVSDILRMTYHRLSITVKNKWIWCMRYNFEVPEESPQRNGFPSCQSSCNEFNCHCQECHYWLGQHLLQARTLMWNPICACPNCQHNLFLYILGAANPTRHNTIRSQWCPSLILMPFNGIPVKGTEVRPKST